MLLALLAARVTGRSRPTCAALAVAVSLAPALLFTTDWVWSEALVQVTLLLFLLAALRFLDVGGMRWGATMVVAAAAGFATHSRLLPLAVTATVLVVVACWRRDLATRAGIGLLALLAVSLLGVARFSSWLVERIWETPAATNTAGGVLDRLSAPGSIAESGIGQLWYQLVASAGLVGIGAIALVRSASRRSADDRPGEPTAVDARVLLVAIAPLIALSVVFMSDRWRPDQIIYGRYNDPAAAIVVLVGLATLVGAGRRRVLVDGAVVVRCARRVRRRAVGRRRRRPRPRRAAAGDGAGCAAVRRPGSGPRRRRDARRRRRRRPRRGGRAGRPPRVAASCSGSWSARCW